MNKNWPRWIYVSAAKHFNNNKGDIPLIIEGQSRDQDPKREVAEFRMNGPIYRNPSGGYWAVDVNIETFLSIAHNEQDSYKVHRIIGQFTTAFPRSILVYKYGDQEEDDQSFLGCLMIKDEGNDTIIVNNFGIVSADIPMYQVSINASYKMELSV